MADGQTIGKLALAAATQGLMMRPWLFYLALVRWPVYTSGVVRPKGRLAKGR